MEVAKNRSIALLSGSAEYWAASITKFIAKYGNKLSESEIADLQKLVKMQDDFKNSIMQEK